MRRAGRLAPSGGVAVLITCAPQRVQVTTGRHFGNEAGLRPWLTALTPASVMCGPYGILYVCVCERQKYAYEPVPVDLIEGLHTCVQW